jgi:hypothetical protein
MGGTTGPRLSASSMPASRLCPQPSNEPDPPNPENPEAGPTILPRAKPLDQRSDTERWARDLEAEADRSAGSLKVARRTLRELWQSCNLSRRLFSNTREATGWTRQVSIR